MNSKFRPDAKIPFEQVNHVPGQTPTPISNVEKKSTEGSNSEAKLNSGRTNTYAETFEAMLDILVYVVFADRPITWRDIQENVVDKHKQTLIRQLKALEKLGYVTAVKSLPNRVHSFRATQKSMQLLGKTYQGENK